MSDTNEQQQQLQESFLQQQEKITALKELVRKSGAAHGSNKTAAKERVKNIAERLLRSKAKSKQGLNVSTYSTETSSPEVSFVAQEHANMSSISQGQFPLRSPTPNFASTPNPAANPTPLKPQISMRNETSPSSIPYSLQSSEKIALMRQQLEQNKLRMAQKASSKQHLEQLVSQLRDKFETTQQCLEDTTELGRSMSDLSNLKHYTSVNRERHKSATDLSNQNFSLEKERIKFLENRCRLLEKHLEKEKQNNQRNNSGNVSSNNIEQLEDKISELEISMQEKENEFEVKEKSLKEELKKLQNIREITEFEASEENYKLLRENEKLKSKIESMKRENNNDQLQQQIYVLNQENLQMTQQLENLRKQLADFTTNNEDQLQNEIEDLRKQLEMFKSKETLESLDVFNENQLLKQETEIQLKRIQELNEINDVLETTRCDLTSKCTELEEQLKQLKIDFKVVQEKLKLSEERCSKLEDFKNAISSHDTDSQVKAEMAKQIQELMDELSELRAENSELKANIGEQKNLEINDNLIAEKISSLESCIEAQREDLLKSQELQKKYEEDLMEKTIELNVLNANFKVLEEKLEASSKTKPLFSSTSGDQCSSNTELELENQQLKQKLDESNKAMIKLKLKCKQTEKQIEKLKKASDLHEEVVILAKEKEQLQQKITELEDEKGQWQLRVMETSQSSYKNDETEQNLQKTFEEKIQVLESMVNEKESELATMKQGEQSRVTSELGEIQLEEQVKELTEELLTLRKDIELKDLKLQESSETINKINKQKDELDKKLEHYLNENIELLDKVEKLSKSSSSAESIEIVERLTQQEKQELEEFNKRLGDSSGETPSQKEAVNELTQTEINPEITESLNKLREESSELMNKIELFTTERREVLEKMENLNTENQELLRRIEELTKEKKDLEDKLGKQFESYDDLETKLNDVTKEKEFLSNQMQEFKNQKHQLSQELTSMQQSSEVVAALDNGETLFEKCEKSLSKLYGELEAYRKANDKKSKFNISKKLAKEAENAHSQLSELLQKVKEASSAVETVTVVETVVAVTAPNGKALAEYEQLTAQNRELKATIQELRRLLDDARDQQEDQADNRFPSEERQAIQLEENRELHDETNKKLQESLQQIEQYETQLTELQSRVEDLTQELYEARTGLFEKTAEITDLSTEIANLKKLSEDFDRLINDKEMTHEKQIEQLTRLRKQLEAKCDTYEQEMEIMQTLVSEQKQQLIEAYKEHEHEMNLKLLELQQQEEKTQEIKQELVHLKQATALQGSELTQDLQRECEKLKESLKINKHLAQEQVEELSNKQETIDTLNQQIIDLYKAMEENANKIIEKEDEISFLQELIDNNKEALSKLEQTHQELLKQNQDLVLVNKQQKDQLNQQLEQLSTLTACQQKVHDLEQRNKEQLDKLKKYAANLKRKAQLCLEYENKLKILESQAQINNNTQELKALNNDNIQLQKELKEAHQKLEDKTKELGQIVNVKLCLEQQVQQLQKELNKKESELETSLQDYLMETQGLQNHFLLTQEQLKEKTQEVKEFQKLLSERDTENVKLKEELQMTQNQMQQQHKNLYASSSFSRVDINETERLRLDLQTAQAVIEKLENDLKTAQQRSAFISDWGDSNEIDQLKEELQCTQENLEIKVREIEELRQSLMAAQEQLTDWGNESSVKNADYENLQKVLEDKSAKLERAETTIEELENNLMTLREKDNENSQKLQTLAKELESLKTISLQTPSNNELENKLKQVTEELKAKSLKFEKSKAVIKERNVQIQRLQSQLKDLQQKLTTCREEEVLLPSTQHPLDAPTQQSIKAELESLQHAYNKLNEKYSNEKTNFQETITRLETLHDGIQAKLQEDMSYIEALEQENNTFKEKICRLQECVSSFEERRASMEHKVNIMDEQMQTKTAEHSKMEDELIYRLNMLSEHDEVIAKRLIDLQNEKEVVEENYGKLQSDHNLLQKQYQKLEKEFSEFKISSNDDYDQELNALKEELTLAKTEMERQKDVYEGRLAAKVTELDELECELSDQLEKINKDKRQLFEQLERMTDNCAAHQNDILRLQENVNTLEQAKSELERESSWLRMQNENSQQDLYELQELRMQSMQDKTEIENLRHQIETLSSNHESELQALRTQIAELDTLRMQVGQNQTDDQVFIETENKRLTDLLAEKEAVIENYQRQNLQLQMAAAAANSNVANQQDPFALVFGLPPQNNTSNNQLVSNDNTGGEIERLSQELQDKNQHIHRLQQDLSNLQTEFNCVATANQEMQSQLADRQQNTVNLQTLQSVASALNESQPTDVIPAPPMFFTADTAVRSPFDDLLQHSHAVDASSAASTEQPPTIEDLQRNVSDLEKHAQDLEHKLATRNQRESEYEDKLRDLDSRYQERGNQLQQSNNELQKVHAELDKLKQQQAELLAQLNELQELRSQVNSLESLLENKDQEINRLKREKQDDEHLKHTMPSLESQILPAFPDPNIQPTLDMFFGNSAPALDFEALANPNQSNEPVVEELIVPKKTYDCHPQEKTYPIDQKNAVTAIDLGEEDWGASWGSAEATAEAEHYAKILASNTSSAPTSLVPREQQLELQNQDMNERLQELQLALERSDEQKKELHIKSGKLMKKLKEYKVKLDELQSTANTKDYRKSSSVESNSMFGDLDAAIQEELKNQIKSLEERLEDQKRQHESFNLEKEKLLKRIDVLTAGNERLSEMKERQDMDVQMYQARIRELQEKVAKLEDWGNEDNVSKPLAEEKESNQTKDTQNISPNTLAELQNQISALTLEVQDLTGDRLELQALLEEEKINLNKAEQTVASLRLQVRALEEAKKEKSTDTYQLNNLKLDMQNLKESYNSLLSNKERLEEEFKTQSETLQMSQTNEKRLQADLDALQLEVETLRDTLNNTKQNLIDLGAELSLLKEQKEKQIDEICCREKKESVDLMKQEIQLLVQQRQTIEEQANQMLKENESLKLNQNSQADIKVLEEKLQSLTAENEYLKSAATVSTFSGSGSGKDEELSALLQEKESEILHLKQRINDLMNEDQTEKLVLEILTKNQEIHLLKMQVNNLEEDKQELENNLSLQITKEMHSNKEDTKQTTKQDDNRVQELETQIRRLQEEKKHMEEELQVLNNHVLESLQLEDKMKVLTLELDTKNIEISELRKTVESLKNNGESNKTQASVDFVTLNKQWEAIVEHRCGEIAKRWQEHLAQRERDFKASEERLQEEISSLRNNQAANLTIKTGPQVLSVETTSSSTAASESPSTSGSTSAEASQDGTPLRLRPEDSDSIIEKMQAALESQEVEIVTLKEQLAIRSAEYASLAAQYDPFKLHDSSSHSAVTAFSENRRQASAAIEAPMVSKSELDLAMYMLHQRDMRCEEMTLEIVNLLSERDTLQLKLSNTLRQLEAKNAQTGSSNEATPATGTLMSSPSENVANTSTAGSNGGNAAEDDLNEKLSQLQTVSHSKDKLIKEEREQRIRQIEKLQQDVAKMPSAAVSELIGSDFSQTSNQSPSNVLLNWLWGSKGGNSGAFQEGF